MLKFYIYYINIIMIYIILYFAKFSNIFENFKKEGGVVRVITRRTSFVQCSMTSIIYIVHCTLYSIIIWLDVCDVYPSERNSSLCVCLFRRVN